MNYPNPLRRCAAFIYDTFIAFAIIMIGTYAVLPLTHGQAISSGNHWYQAYLLFLLFAYWGGFWWWKGQTVGMHAWKIKVTQLNGSPLKFWQVFLRFVFGFTFSIIGLLFCFFNKKHQSLYDLITNSNCVASEP